MSSWTGDKPPFWLGVFSKLSGNLNFGTCGDNPGDGLLKSGNVNFNKGLCCVFNKKSGNVKLRAGLGAIALLIGVGSSVGALSFPFPKSNTTLLSHSLPLSDEQNFFWLGIGGVLELFNLTFVLGVNWSKCCELSVKYIEPVNAGDIGSNGEGVNGWVPFFKWGEFNIPIIVFVFEFYFNYYNNTCEFVGGYFFRSDFEAIKNHKLF